MSINIVLDNSQKIRRTICDCLMENSPQVIQTLNQLHAFEEETPE